MDSPEQLIRLAPVLRRIDNWAAGFLRACIQSSVDRSRETNPNDLLLEIRCFRERDREATDDLGYGLPDNYRTQEEFDARPRESMLELVNKLLCHEDILSVTEGGLSEMRESMRVFAESDDPQELLNAGDNFVDASFEFLEHFFQTEPQRLFRDWGSRFFEYLVLDDDPRVAHRFSQAFGTRIDGDAPIRPSMPVIDEDTFSVSVGNGTPCFIGNNKQFLLLAKLLANPNRFVSFADLAEAINGDTVDQDSIPVLKCRLCGRLRNGGLGNLADQIVAQPRHYAYQPERRAIEM